MQNQNVGNRGSGEPRRHSENGGQGMQFNNPSEHNVGNKGSGEPRRHTENGGQGMHFHTPAEHNVRRTNYSRNSTPSNILILRLYSCRVLLAS